MNNTAIPRKSGVIVRAGLAGLRWLLIAALLLAALNLKDPHLLPLRQYETALLLLLSAGAMALYLRRPRSSERLLGLGLLAAVLLLTLWGEFSFRYRKAGILGSDASTVRQLGQHFVVGYDSLQELRPLVSKGLVGGIFVTQHNARGKSSDDLRREIGELQALRKAAALPALIVTTDQEGGIVSRLSPPLAKQPPLAALADENLSRAELGARAEAYGREQGQALAALGVTVNFSPVVDLKSSRANNPLDFHSLINKRAISAQPELTAELAQAYVRGLESRGIRATLKHFPGLGRVASDTHHFSAVLDAPLAELEASDWIPFRQIAKGTGALIMLSHVILAELDRENPVSFSRAVVQNVIRAAWKFDGVLITDDLTMGAAYNHGLCGATIKSLNAGVDLLLISYDYEKLYEALYCAHSAYDSGLLDKAMLDLSSQRLLRLGSGQAVQP